ncbi:MAG: ribonuclease PH [bacterium]
MGRIGDRSVDQIRPVEIQLGFTKYAEGSVLITMGDTKVICNATVEDRVPHFRKGSGSGWVTSEYGMLPRATGDRTHREQNVKGRSMEIQRLIGRALRAVVNLDYLGERQVILDADVIQADGGTRTASITGCFVALYEACRGLMKNGLIQRNPVQEFVAAISVGIINGEKILDLNYHEDFNADVDMNIVMTESGNLVEVQGTAEKHPFSQSDMGELIKLAAKGTSELIKIQKKALGLIK